MSFSSERMKAGAARETQGESVSRAARFSRPFPEEKEEDGEKGEEGENEAAGSFGGAGKERPGGGFWPDPVNNINKS